MSLPNFGVETPRPLPVIVLADVSGSMEGIKIQTLNAALAEMRQELATQFDPRAEVYLAVFAFHSHVEEVLPLTRAAEAQLLPLYAAGSTELGQAYDAVREMLEDKGRLPLRAYLPMVVLLTDGEPTDRGRWEPALERLLASERGGKAIRLAVNIGADSPQQRDVLARFVNNAELPPVMSEDVATIRRFFQFVTNSTKQRSVATNPNQAGSDFADEYRRFFTQGNR